MMKYEIDSNGERGHYVNIFKNTPLLITLIKRDFTVRYRNMFLGNLWVLLRPVLFTIIFVSIFSKIQLVEGVVYPYALFAFSGLGCWQFIQSSLTDSSLKFQTHEELIKKVYFPRLSIILASVIVNAFDFCVVSLILGFISFYFGELNATRLLAFPLFTLLIVIIYFPLTVIVSILNIRFKDFRLILPFLVQVSFYITPVVYLLEAKQGLIFYINKINPFSGLVYFYRWIFISSEQFQLDSLLPVIVFFFITLLISRIVVKTYLNKIVELL